jgi:glycosyltransferase involved in cell wall biosynthesis
LTPRIALFTGIYPPDTGGPAKFAETFAQYCTEHNVEIMVYAYSDAINQESVSYLKNATLIPSTFSILKRYIQMIQLILAEVSKGSLILVNGCFWEIAIARHFKRFKYVTKVPGDIVWERARNQGRTQKSIDEFNRKKWLQTDILRHFFIYSLKKSQFVIVPSRHLGGLCVAWGVKGEKIVAINNSVSTSKFFPDATKPKRYDFIVVCRLVPWKGVNEIIDAAAELKARLLVVGNGPEREMLELRARNLQAMAEFKGNVQQDQLPQLLQAANAFVLNSNFEATSYALLEAQSSGLLVIANEMTGSEEVISHNRNGLLCGNLTGLTLMDAMKRCLEESVENSTIKSEARKNVIKNFNMEKNYRQILELVQSL